MVDGSVPYRRYCPEAEYHVVYGTFLVPKDELYILAMQREAPHNNYARIVRVLANRQWGRVVYVFIHAGPATQYMLDALDQGHEDLPPITTGTWNTLHVVPDGSGLGVSLEYTWQPLPEVPLLTMHQHVDFLEAGSYVRSPRNNLHEVLAKGRPMMMRIMSFPSDHHALCREMWALLTLDTRCGFMDPYASPEFRAVVTENHRPVGFMLDKIDGYFPGPRHVAQCRDVVRKVHSAGLCHNNLRRHHFIVDALGRGRVYLVSFERAIPFDAHVAQRELDALPMILREVLPASNA